MSEHFSNELALKNEAVQIQVSADYNFHSEESFKVNYWTRVVAVLSSEHDFPCAISVASLRSWWRANVSNRSSLPGLNKVFFAATTTVSLASLVRDYEEAFSPSSAAPAPSLLKSVVTKIWNLFSNNDDVDESPKSVPNDEIVFDQVAIEKFVKHRMSLIQEEESIVVSEEKIFALIEKYSVIAPFVEVPEKQLRMAVVALMVKRFGAVGFTVGDNQRCLKLPPKNLTQTPPVTEAEKAILMYELALEKLGLEEAVLLAKWTSAGEKIQTHLQAGRKPLALTALKERKLVEKRLEDLGHFRQKLEETASLTQTAILQKTVVSAIAVGTAAAKVHQSDVDHVTDLMDAVAEMQSEIDQVSRAFVPQDDAEINEEYAQLEMALKTEKMETLLSLVPSVPVSINAEQEQVHKESTPACSSEEKQVQKESTAIPKQVDPTPQ